MTKEYDKNKNPLYTNKSFLMTINWKDLPNHPKWKQLIKECYEEHGYGWWWHKNMKKGNKTNFTRPNRKKKTRGEK